MAGHAGAGEGSFWKRNGRWYGKRRIGPREAVVTINASGTTLAEAKADLRAKLQRHERGGQAFLDASVTLERYLDWWFTGELAERVTEGSLVETTRQQYANKIRFQIVPVLGSTPTRCSRTLSSGRFVTS